MVGFDDKKNLQLSQTFIAGFLSGIITRALVSPVDVVKIRFQLQPEKWRSQLKYKRIFQATKVIYKEEGWMAFWKGHIPAQFLSMIYGGVQFTTFQQLTKLVYQIYPYHRDDHTTRSVIFFGCGSLAGAAATIAAQPADVLRTRFAAQKEPVAHRSYTQAVQHMLKNEGVFSFYKGLTPAIIQIIPYSGLQFASYSLLQALWRKGGLQEGSICNLLCGGGAGVIGKALVYPLDVTKKRLQVQGFNKATVSKVVSYSNFRNCIHMIWKTEGLRGFYKGGAVSVIKACTSTGLAFFTYELFVELLSAKTF
ncbi:mitochondrial thiamine pyrophosphate carrier-like [Clavelina lepadiformis]|uniref:Mitochondrial thiamine pyrophosphate carrier n=1 Tax=Clavelina lepadiformis TaxID=159417 RepID=A0ABP0FQ92_CLALP